MVCILSCANSLSSRTISYWLLFWENPKFHNTDTSASIGIVLPLSISERRHRGRRCSFTIHVRHAAAVIASDLCDTVVITHARAAALASGAPECRGVDQPRQPV